MPTQPDPVQVVPELNITGQQPDYSHGYSVKVSTVFPNTGVSLKLNKPITALSGNTETSYDFDIDSAVQSADANNKYPLAWNFYYKDGSTYTTLPYSVDRATKLHAAIKFYLYFVKDAETSNISQQSDGTYAEDGQTKFVDFDSTKLGNYDPRASDIRVETKIGVETNLSDKTGTATYSLSLHPNLHSSEILLSDLYYTTTQGATNKRKSPVPASELTQTVEKSEKVISTSMYGTGGPYKGGRRLE
jgi:hypothetical protein